MKTIATKAGIETAKQKTEKIKNLIEDFPASQLDHRSEASPCYRCVHQDSGLD